MIGKKRDNELSACFLIGLATDSIHHTNNSEKGCDNTKCYLTLLRLLFFSRLYSRYIGVLKMNTGGWFWSYQAISFICFRFRYMD